MTTERLASKAGLKTAAVGALAGAVGAWFLVVVLAASKGVAVGAALLVAVAAVAYVAGFRAGEGVSDGE